MKDNLTDKQKLEIEEHAEEIIKKQPVKKSIIVSAGISLLSGTSLLLLGIVFMFIYWIMGLIMIIVGALFINSANKSTANVKKLKEEDKEKMIKKLQLKALNGEDWKNKN